MAEIFLAREMVGQELSRNIVVKVLRESALARESDGRFEQLFLREGRVAAQLVHPNICHVYEFGRHRGHYFIAMEYVEGASLRDVLGRLAHFGEKLQPELTAWIFAQMASALHYAHTACDARRTPLGVVHRDVSPQNIMLRGDGVVKLLDFGVAHVATAEGEQKTGLLFGKVAYMAPEQCTGESRIDGRADVFSLGVCLYETLTGRRLYRRKDDAETLKAVLQEPPPSIQDVDPSLPDALRAIVERALQKEPDERFADAGEMAQALDAYLAESGQVVNAASAAAVMRRLFAEQLTRGPRISTEIDISDLRGSGRSVSPDRSTLRPPATVRPLRLARPSLRAALMFAAAILVAAWLALQGDDVPEPSASSAPREAAQPPPWPERARDVRGEGAPHWRGAFAPGEGAVASTPAAPGDADVAGDGEGERGAGAASLGRDGSKRARPGFVQSPGF
jgi:serine/threonine-protein kinase